MTKRLSISEYRGMWMFAMFDLPTDTKAARRGYTRFRAALLKDGFEMMRYSVYARYCPSEEASEVHRKRIKKALPQQGEVRVLAVTDRQFGKMDVFRGKKKKATEAPPDQLLLL